MQFTNYLGFNSNSSLTDLEINRNEIIYKKHKRARSERIPGRTAPGRPSLPGYAREPAFECLASGARRSEGDGGRRGIGQRPSSN
jgi:hypothetical protein